MKLKTLRLRNFRSHAETVLADLGRINLVRGANGSGKSSICDAIEWALTSKCRLTDEGGKGADALASTGAAEFSVQAVLSGEQARVLNRARSGGGGTITIQGDPQSKFFLGSSGAETWIADNLGNREVLSVVLRAGRFVSMNEKEQREFLSAALASKPVDISEDIWKTIVASSSLHAFAIPTRSQSSAAELDRTYKDYFDLRADLKREIKSLGDLEAPVRPPDMPTAEVCAQGIADLEFQKRNLEARRAVAISTAQHARTSGLESAKKERADRLKKHADDCARLKVASASLKEQKPLIVSDAELAAIEKTLKGKTKIEKADQDIAAAQAEIKFKREQVVGLTENKSCAACQRPFDKPEGAADQIDVLTGEIGSREAWLVKAQAARLAMGDPATAEERLRKHRAAIIAVEAAEKVMLELKKMPAECDTRDLDAIINQEQPPDLFANQCDTSAIDSDIAALAGRITNGQAIKDKIVEFDGRLKQHAQTEAQKATLQTQIDSIQKVIDAFAPAGPIRAQLVGDKLEPFKDALVNALQRFGFHCDLSIEPYSLKVSGTPTYKPLSVRQLSESEQFRFSVAFQVAIAEATGVKFAVFDRSDVLLSDVRPLLSRLLMESSLEQAFVMVATNDLSPLRVPEGVKVFDLVKDEHGVTRLVGAEKTEEVAA